MTDIIFGKQFSEEKDIEFNKLLEFLSIFKENKSEHYLIFSEQKRELRNKIEEILEKFHESGIITSEISLWLSTIDPYFQNLKGKNKEEMEKLLNRFLQERLINPYTEGKIEIISERFVSYTGKGKRLIEELLKFTDYLKLASDIRIVEEYIWDKSIEVNKKKYFIPSSLEKILEGKVIKIKREKEGLVTEDHEVTYINALNRVGLVKAKLIGNKLTPFIFHYLKFVFEDVEWQARVAVLGGEKAFRELVDYLTYRKIPEDTKVKEAIKRYNEKIQIIKPSIDNREKQIFVRIVPYISINNYFDLGLKIKEKETFEKMYKREIRSLEKILEIGENARYVLAKEVLEDREKAIEKYVKDYIMFGIGGEVLRITLENEEKINKGGFYSLKEIIKKEFIDTKFVKDVFFDANTVEELVKSYNNMISPLISLIEDKKISKSIKTLSEYALEASKINKEELKQLGLIKSEEAYMVYKKYLEKAATYLPALYGFIAIQQKLIKPALNNMRNSKLLLKLDKEKRKRINNYYIKFFL